MAKGSEQWQALQELYGILETVEQNSFALITAEQINQAQAHYPNLKFEARLLTHFDNSRQLPELFSQNGLCILPVQRGSYVIGHFNIFQNVDHEIEDIELKTLPALVELESIQEKNLANETMGLNFAFAHGITSDFIGDKLTATIAGRQNGGNWSYQIESGNTRIELQAENPQIEIDGGYEGLNEIVLIEAKNSLVKQFCLRQLYFPYRCWLSKSDKEIITVFAEINGGEVVLSEYAFPEPNLFKAVLLRSMRYRIASDVITRSELQRLIMNANVEPEPTNIVFPQANSLSRTIDLIEHLAETEETKSKFDIAEYYGFDDRQGDYYGNSAAYLGFVDKVASKGYKINQAGKDLCSILTAKQKNIRIIEALLKHPVFMFAITRSLECNELLPIEEIAPIIELNTNLTKGTPIRRASTVRKWVMWVMNVIQ